LSTSQQAKPLTCAYTAPGQCTVLVRGVLYALEASMDLGGSQIGLHGVHRYRESCPPVWTPS
jgi:microcompartment protein CcmL/EutN